MALFISNVRSVTLSSSRGFHKASKASPGEGYHYIGGGECPNSFRPVCMKWGPRVGEVTRLIVVENLLAFTCNLEDTMS